MKERFDLQCATFWPSRSQWSPNPYIECFREVGVPHVRLRTTSLQGCCGSSARHSTVVPCSFWRVETLSTEEKCVQFGHVLICQGICFFKVLYKWLKHLEDQCCRLRGFVCTQNIFPTHMGLTIARVSN